MNDWRPLSYLAPKVSSEASFSKKGRRPCKRAHVRVDLLLVFFSIF